jgi:tetratricopeptide (TPR) repeat protein
MSDPVAASRLSFEENLNVLFEEIVLARKWDRPSILLAVHKSRFGQQRAEEALQERLQKIGVTVTHITVDSEHSDVPHIIVEAGDPAQTVFFVSNIGWGGGADRMDAYRALNIYRELFVDHQLRVVLWLTVSEAATLARFSPDFWSFRHRVVEFTGQRIPRQIKLAAGTLLWDVQNSVDPFDTLEARIGVREELLAKLPQNAEARSSRVDLLYNLGYLYWVLGDTQRSTQRLHTGLELAPGPQAGESRSSLLNGLAILSYEAKDFARAAELLQQALLAHADDAMLLINLSIVSNALGRNQEAATFAGRAVKLRPRDPRMWSARGYLLAAQGKFDDAIDSFSKAIELGPHAASVHAALAILYDLVERTEEMARELDLARSLAQGPMLTFVEIYEAAMAGNSADARQEAHRAIKTGRITARELRRDPNLSLLFDPAGLDEDPESNPS